MKLKILSLILSFALTAPHLVWAENLVVFGDSLSDIGQKDHPKGYLKATYNDSNNQANLFYAEIVAQDLGSKLTASSRGGTDYAYSGGVLLESHLDDPAKQQPLATENQIQHYLQDHSNRVKDNALHILWGGGNDAAAILATAVSETSKASGDPTKLAQVQMQVLQDTQQTGEAAAKQASMLHQAGASLIVMPNVPNIFYTPEIMNQFRDGVVDTIRGKLSGLGGGLSALGINPADEFEKAYNEALQSHLTDQQTDLNSFLATRETILNEAIDKLYASSSGSLLKLGGYDKAAFSQLIHEQYQSVASGGEQITNLLNQGINNALDQTQANVLRLDVNQLFTDMLSNPKSYGFSYTVNPACQQHAPKTLCTQATGVSGSQMAPADADNYLFADSFHPGPKAHRIMADYLMSTLQAPQQIAQIGSHAISQSHQLWDFAYQEGHRHTLQEPQTLDIITAYQYDNTHSQTLHLGGKIQWNPHWQTALIYSRQRHDSELNGMNLKADSNALTTYTRYQNQNWWLGAGIQIIDSNYQAQRHIHLGDKNITQHSDTGGNSQSISLFGGYRIPLESQHNLKLLAHGTYSKGHIAGFAEHDAGATRMIFGEQNPRSFQTGIGSEYQADWGAFSLYARALWEKEWLQQSTRLEANMAQHPFYTDINLSRSSSINTALGLSWQPTAKLRAFGQLNHRFYRQTSQQSQTGINLGVAMRF